ncbi:hypothetical protein PHYSODRAFT_303062 [Phytophthora sojae]|uniref:Uncharacterized protein n=1 Tax=Phytophthora sojae (strain P6497) TaxID=1094619 RepID=G4ZUS1_PHYSP|nr:hypothetical protein PHYSODRAFT_303062 [Phytophthora sojae]EGZ13545.1 hypothetical protein PHYSODRAFT_303062 [Phytophthora sojae]|eukprot:XP_009530974.1 hypothetical protein PHYSODRAFT_303062 [Phytophthora sojae]
MGRPPKEKTANELSFPTSFPTRQHGTIAVCRLLVPATYSNSLLLLSLTPALNSHTPVSLVFHLRFSTPTVPTEDEEGDASDSDDEWGIVHAPKIPSARPRPSRIRLRTTSHGIRVSLVLSVAGCHRAPSRLRLQRSQATWTFHDSIRCPHIALRFVQDPAFTIGFVLLSQFDAYVTDRLECATRRHAEWTKGSALCWCPRLTTAVNVNGTEIATVPQRACTDKPASEAAQQNSVHLSAGTIAKAQESRTQSHQQINGVKQVKLSKTKETRRPWTQRFAPEARYMKYEQSASYTRRRQENIERRRRALQPASSTNPADSKCIPGSRRRLGSKHLAEV